jgi:hypothetical protein
MTKINSNGQIEWTFEEIDLEGALKDVIFLHNKFAIAWRSARDLESLRIYSNEVCKYMDVIRNINWLIRKGGVM